MTAPQRLSRTGVDTSAARRLLADVGGGPSLLRHLETHGPVPYFGAERLFIEEVNAAGLTGRGGAAFPVARKLRAVADGSRPIVVGNGSEGEPASSKDKVLLAYAPHLVLDGLQLAAETLGANEVYLAVCRGVAEKAVRRALAERTERGLDRIDVRVHVVAEKFLSGEESALVSQIQGGRPAPQATPPRMYEKGVFGRPTLVQNVETLAHLALIARHGAAWFREQGTVEQPGTMLVTVSGSVGTPGVLEVPIGANVLDVIDQAGGMTGPHQAILFGGYHGAWISEDPAELRLANLDLKPFGASAGAGVIAALPQGVCGLWETARVVSYLARESARQCGPCLNGLPALAEVLTDLARGRGTDHRQQVAELVTLVERRGACHHPDGSVRFIRSAFTAFDEELALHARGACSGTGNEPFLPTPRLRPAAST